MSKILVIKAHPHIENSLSLKVGDEFIKEYKVIHPNDQIVIRDLFDKEGVPPLNDITMEAWRKQKFGEKLSDEEENTIKRHEEWLAEFISADKYIFINPMYNHFIPAELKQYLDLTAVAHKTFKYTTKGSVGLLAGKKVMHIQAAGGVYHKQGKWGTFKFLIKKVFGKSDNTGSALLDLGSLYLNNIMQFYGITDLDNIYIEGADKHRDERSQILAKAIHKAKITAKKF